MGWRWHQRIMKFAQASGLYAGLGAIIILASPHVLGRESGLMGSAPTYARGHASAAELTLIASLAVFSGLVAMAYLFERRRCMEREAKNFLDLAALQAKLDRVEVFLGAETQIITAWTGPGENPEISGDLELAGGRPNARGVLAFNSWLPPEMAQTAKNSVIQLRTRGKSFRFTATSLDGRHLEIASRPPPASPSCGSGMFPAITARPFACRTCTQARPDKLRRYGRYSTRLLAPPGCAMTAAN